MLDETLLRPLLNDILESPEFKDSQRYRDLLLYLVEEYQAGRAPKEVTIGMHFFGKDASFNSKVDASVRVYLANLRKKLDHYYLTTTKPYSHKLRIPVGHYKIEFIPLSELVEKPNQKNRSRLFAYIGIGISGLIILLYAASTILQFKDHHAGPPNPMWNDFVKPNGRPTLIIFGDYFFLREKGGTGNYFRNSKINSIEDFQQVVSQDPKLADKYEQIGFTFLRSSTPWGLAHVLPIVQNSYNSYTYKLASQFTMSDFKSSNVIFIGTFKTLYLFKKFLNIFKLDYTLRPSSFKITDAENDSTYQFVPSRLRAGDYEKDYGVIAKGAGPDGSILMMMLGNSETGVIQAIQTACDPNVDEVIEKKYSVKISQDPCYFTLVIDAEGMNEAIFSSNVSYFKLNKPLKTISDAAPTDSSKNN